MFGMYIKGKNNWFASSGNSDNKSGLIPDIIIDVYHCNQLIQHCLLNSVSVSKISDRVNSRLLDVYGQNYLH